MNLSAILYVEQAANLVPAHHRYLPTMQLEDLVVLLPCYSLEDLPLEWAPDEAESLLSAWSALYHPALLVAAARTPRWFRADDPPSDATGKLIVVPQCCESRLPMSWLESAECSGACILRNIADRADTVDRALACVDADLSRLDPALAEDFLALGYCNLLVELLTRQLRYMSNLDTDAFQRDTLAAAEKALQGDSEGAREGLRSVFDLLATAREYYYPVEANLLDVTLVVPTTAGAKLREELGGNAPVSLLLSGETLDEIAQQEPATLEAIRDAIGKGHVTIIGGEHEERELPLMPLEAILSQFQRGFASYEQHLGQRPTIYGRRRFGLTPALPGILNSLGFSGALHFTLDDGRFPADKQSKMRWKGKAPGTIDALARVPIDASRSEQFFRLPEKLGNTMDLDHAATVVFAHWPGRATPWYRDLQRMGEYSPAVGQFCPMGEYFENTHMTGTTQCYSPDEYRSPYLRQAVAAGQHDPISRWVRYHRTRVALEGLRSLATLSRLAGGNDMQQIERLFCEADDIPASVQADTSDLEQRVAHLAEEAASQFAGTLCGARSQTSAQKGYLLLNSLSFPRRVSLDVSELSRPAASEGAVWRCVEIDGRKEAIVDVPPMGFAWVDDTAEAAPAPKPSVWRRKSKKPEPPLAEPYVLRNDYFVATIDPTTGGIRSICLHNTRGNRVAQQLAMRIPAANKPKNAWGEEDTELDYTIMAADEINVSADPLTGRMEIRGRLMDRGGQAVARFVENLAVRRGSRVLEMDIELDVDRQPEGNPWNSYYAVRFAWGNAVIDMCRSVHGTTQPTEAVLMEAPQFISLLSGGTNRTTILTGGLPYHRCFAPKKLDTLLIVKGETARRFRMGIGVDVKYPVPAALDFVAEPMAVKRDHPPVGSTGWLLHLDARNVITTDCEPLISEGAVVGYRARLLETEGRATEVGLRSFRPVASAQRRELDGRESTVLPVADDRVTIGIGAYEWVSMEARFQT